MTCCNHCRDAGGFFGDRTARRELRRYRRNGPPKSTRRLIDALRSADPGGATLLDVGGGVGAIQHELFDAGLRSAVQVDASAAYLDAARREAEARGHADRAEFHFGDFVEMADELPRADLVTLDRVICCYPHLDDLLDVAVGRTRRVLGLVYPRERMGTRLFLALGNLWFRLRRSDFRVFLHPVRRVHRRLRDAGFRPDRNGRTFLWRVETWVRDPAPAPSSPDRTQPNRQPGARS